MITENQGIYDARKLGKAKFAVLGVQHLFAMFGATILVPLITGLDVSATLLFAGIGTLIFHFISQLKVPAFLGSSFAFLGGYASVKQLCVAQGLTNEVALDYACIGVAAASLLYFVMAFLLKMFGTEKVMRFFPPVVTGPMVIAIGLTLSGSAISNCQQNWLLAVTAIVIVIATSIWGKGIIKIVPILLGVLGSYILAAATGEVDFTKLSEVAWVGLPINMERTAFAVMQSPNFDLIITSVIAIFPIAFATIMEHIGDMCAIQSTVGKNFIKDPGLHRTLSGDGLATFLASLFGAPANTTYGENTGVLSLSKVYDPRVIRIAAVLAILVSFCPKFSAFIGTIPGATIGGVSFVLYGMISAVGVRNLVESQVDLGKSRNMLIAAIILVLTLGISFSKAGAVKFAVGGVNFALSGLAVGALTGILLNAILPGKDFQFSETDPSIKDADRWGGVKPDGK